AMLGGISFRFGKKHRGGTWSTLVAGRSQAKHSFNFFKDAPQAAERSNLPGAGEHHQAAPDNLVEKHVVPRSGAMSYAPCRAKLLMLAGEPTAVTFDSHNRHTK